MKEIYQSHLNSANNEILKLNDEISILKFNLLQKEVENLDNKKILEDIEKIIDDMNNSPS
jgi:hypothetical protein